MKRVILKPTFIVVLLLGLANIADYIYASVSTNAATSNLSMQATILPSMTVVIDDTNPTLNITPSSTGTFDSTSVNVSAYSNGSIGYNLTMTPSNTDLTGISTGSTIPTLTSGSYTSANFPAGYWGVSVDSGNYVPAAVTSLATVNASNANVATNTHAVNLAANLDLTTAMDSYSTTLTFAATATVQAYPITFNFNNNITSLAIKDANNVTKATITTSGGSANLDFANTYTIVPTYAVNDGFLVSWLSSGTGYYNNNNLTYTVGSGSATVNLTSLVYMQDFKTLSSSNLASVKNAMELEKQYQLKDNRDQKPYYIAKLADGNVWMTQNLDHDIVTTANFYTPQNTDVPSTWTASTATYATGVTTWDNTTTGNYAPQSYNPGDYCWSGALEDGTPVSCSQNGNHFHLGNYYSWTAAVATNDSSSYATSTDVDRSICPAGWTLPKDGSITTSGSLEYLVTQYGWDDDSYLMEDPYYPWDSPLYSSLSGNWKGAGLETIGELGHYWSSVTGSYNSNGADAMFYEYYDHNSSFYPASSFYRYNGLSVRCVAR